MAILTRLARLFKADLHALLDRMEAPDILLQQAIREMEAELQASLHLHKQLQRQLQQLQQQIVANEKRAQEYEGELALCLDADNDSLARTLLRRKLETAQRLQVLKSQQQNLHVHLQEEATEIQYQQNTYDTLRAQTDLLLPPDEVGVPPGPDIQIRISDADIELALLKAKRERSLP